MIEEILVTVRDNAKVDPSLDIWGWEISVYLFLGGLTAGIMFFAALLVLLRREQDAPFAANRLALYAPIVLSAGMTTLFLDLEHKLYVFRFYTTFQPTAPMSWGAWVLILVYPISILQTLSSLRAGYPRLAAAFERLPLATVVLELAQRYRRPIAAGSLPIAIALAIYTGILLSAFSARPFWNTGILGPLFLVSGLSTAAAFAILLATDPGERSLFARFDIGLIATEMVVVALLVINLSTGPQVQLDAVHGVLGGDHTLMFWGLFFTLGLVIPLFLELGEARLNRRLVLLGPVLVLFGGLILRQVVVDLGQESTWTEFTNQYNVELLQRLERE